MTQKELADRYSELREKNGLTIASLANLLNCNPKTLSFYENGSREMPRNVLIKYADYFNVTTDFLLGRTKDPAQKPSAVDELGLWPIVVSKLQETVDKDAISNADIVNGLIDDENFEECVRFLTSSVNESIRNWMWENNESKQLTALSLSSIYENKDEDKEMLNLRGIASRRGLSIVSTPDASTFYQRCACDLFSTICKNVINKITEHIINDLTIQSKGMQYDDEDNET